MTSGPCEKTSKTSSTINMYRPLPNHAIVATFSDPLTFYTTTGQVEFTIVNPNNKGENLLSAEVNVGNETYSESLLTASTGSVTGGKVVYFTFNPSLYPPLLYKTIQYLR
jgi:hypothetical protein